jgi:deoxyribonuclease V
MRTKDLHSWDLSYSQARDLQKRLASGVKFIPLKRQPRLLAGLDCAFSQDGRRIVAAAVVLKWPGFEPVDTAVASRRATFPYIPGLLSFREAPVCIAAVKKLRADPDVFVIDGQGVAHPRRLGLAAHLGLFFDRPAASKRRLYAAG